MVRAASSILGSIIVVFFAIGAVEAQAAGSSASPAGGSDEVTLLNSPHSDNTPVVVHLGLYVTDLSSVDEANESFEMRGYFYARWQDDRLKSGNPIAPDRVRTLNENRIWSPLLQVCIPYYHRIDRSPCAGKERYAGDRREYSQSIAMGISADLHRHFARPGSNVFPRRGAVLLNEFAPSGSAADGKSGSASCSRAFA